MARHAVLFVSIVATLVAPRAAGYPWPTCGTTGSFPANDSTYLASINTIAATLPRNASASPGLYATGQAGQVWALALCRGDLNATSCFDCLTKGFHDLPSVCVYSKYATMYYDKCFLHYSNIHVRTSDLTARRSELSITSVDNVTAVPARFDRVVTVLLNATADYAAYNSSVTRLYASGMASFDQEIPDVYSWAQCTPGLTPVRCRVCLAHMIKALKSPLYAVWAGYLGIMCSVRYDNKPFLDGPLMVLRLPATGGPAPSSTPAPGAPATSSTPAPAIEGEKQSNSATRISVGIVCSLILVSIISAFAFSRFRRRNKAKEDHENPFKNISRAQCMIFDLPALVEATESFSERNKLGEGGFGVVYKGILPDGQEIAVKKLRGRAGHGLHQLHNEVLVLAELQHKNLVQLRGFYSHRDDTLLVYEYIKNGSLARYLSDTGEGHTLIWEQKYNIILGVAKGILYLHEDSIIRIIHRDLKPNNILLDEDMEPKIADFGLARLLGEGHTHTKTSRAVGTLGYMAPEYVYNRRVSPKIDIFSYGLLILQIVTTRRKCWSDDGKTMNLLTEVWSHWKKGTISRMMDKTLNQHTQNQQLRCIYVGLMCVQADPSDRPEISTVISMLTRDNMDLQPLEEPAFFFRSEPTSDFMSGDDISVNGVTVTDLCPR
uniref:Predicted protein n=1 Tax=Hordeum vulgare subsp. vulgare TaxID=112509 RepID=F2DNN1_HORVV|nr:predicted protein [Hordeum vulgare subsp. vulgare]